jgi:sulfonate transport system permease protein
MRTSVVIRSLRQILISVLPAVVVLVGWEIAGRISLDAALLGEPSKIFEALVRQALGARIWYHTWVTASEVMIGYAIGVAAGFAVGYAVGVSEPLARVVEPYVLLINAIPKVAVAPLFIVFFGIGLASKVAIVVSMVFFLMFYAVYVGLRTIDAEFIYQARIMGISRPREIWQIVLPSILPNMLVGLKTSAAAAIIGAIIGEIIVSRAGLGFYIMEASGSFDVNGIWVGVIFLMLLLSVMTGTIALVERRFLRWMPRKRIG